MMKFRNTFTKLLAIALISAVSAASLTACGEKTALPNANTPPDTVQESSQSTASEEEAPAAEQTEEFVPEDPDAPVIIKDPAFAAALHGWIEFEVIDGVEQTTAGQCAKLKRFMPNINDVEQPLTNISDIKNFPNLEAFDAKSHDITSLAGIENCKRLTYLELSRNEIVDLTPLAGCDSLTDLILSGNSKITDVSPLKDLKNLKIAVFSSSLITDWSPIEHIENLNKDA